jgi:hypothetical protein
VVVHDQAYCPRLHESRLGAIEIHPLALTIAVGSTINSIGSNRIQIQPTRNLTVRTKAAEEECRGDLGMHTIPIHSRTRLRFAEAIAAWGP